MKHPERPATKAQAKFIESLASRAGQDSAMAAWSELFDRPLPGHAAGVTRYAAYELTMGQASDLIEALKDAA